MFKLIVIRTANLQESVAFYTQLGLDFVEEQHGNGPVHSSAQLDGIVFEIYPAKNRSDVDVSTRLGFSVEHAPGIEFQDTPWGQRGVVTDPDGRSVELYLTARDNETHARQETHALQVCDAASPKEPSCEFVTAAIEVFQNHKHLAERAIEQLPDDALRVALDDNTNSIAIIMKHISGNLASRWTDFLTTDGEKPWRNRDDEFVDDFTSREQLVEFWQRGWDCLFQTLDRLTEIELAKTVFIRGQAHSVPQAIQRSLGHTCYHVGQIVQVSRFHAKDRWTDLTIPRGESQAYNRDHWGT